MIEAHVYSDNDWGHRLTAFKVMEIQVKPTNDLISAPVETGTESFDNQVRKPNVIIVSGYVNCEEDNADQTIEKIDDMFRNRKFEFFSVATKEAFYNNLKLQDAPHSEKSEKPDFLMYELVFKEILLVQKQSAIPLNNENSDSRGQGKIAAQ